MAALIDIVNRALGYLGAEALVSLDQATPLAAKVKAVWPLVRDDVLRDHPWNCCQRRVNNLGRLANRPAFGFRAQFQLPADCLRLVQVWPDVQYQVEGNVLLAQAEALSIVYVCREENTQRYDAQLLSALGIRLGAELAYGVSSSTSLAQSLEELYQKKLREAKGVNSREADPDVVIRASTWVAAHYGR